MRRVGWVNADVNYGGDIRSFAWAFVAGRPQLLGNFASRVEAEQFLARPR